MKYLNFALLGGLLLATMTGAHAASDKPIKIGEINSYSTMPQFTQPYRQGWQLAVEEINVAGGLLGRKVEVIARRSRASRHRADLA